LPGPKIPAFCIVNNATRSFATLTKGVKVIESFYTDAKECGVMPIKGNKVTEQ
jgi:hypothetical protein